MNQKTRLIGAGVLCIIANIFAVITVSFAWFSAARDVRPTGDFSVVSPEEYSIEYSIYEFNYDFTRGEEVEYFDLNNYDTYIQSRNEYNSKLIKITVDCVASATDSKVSIEVPCIRDFAYTPSGSSNIYVGNYISNVISFKTARYSCLNTSGTTSYDFTLGTSNKFNPDGGYIGGEGGSDQLYQEVKKYFDGVSADNTFVDKETLNEDVSSVEKTRELKFEAFTIPANTTEVVFFIEYNYNTTLANYFYNHFNPSSVISGEGDLADQTVKFYSDISEISIQVSK